MFDVLSVLILLQLKHLFIDFYWQKPFHYENKGTYGHPGGIEHAAMHGIGTFLCFLFYLPFMFILAILAGLIDMVLHYHIDWAKVNLTKYYNVSFKDEKYWRLLGLDQYMHQITYIALLAFIHK